MVNWLATREAGRAGARTLAALAVSAMAATAVHAESGLLQNLMDNASFTLRGVATAYPQDPGSTVSDDDSAHLTIRQQVSSSGDISDSLALNFSAYAAFATQPKENTGIFRDPGSEERTARALDFTQLYLTYFADAFEVVVGKRVIETGVAEMVRPTNRFGLVDASSPMDPEAFGVWHVGLIYPLADDLVSLRVAPFHERSVAPSALSRWLGASGDPDFVAINIPAGAPALPPTGIATVRDDYHSPNPDNWSYLLKYEGVGSGFDYFGFVHHGPSVYPVLRRVSPTSYRKVDPLAWSFGGGVSTVLDRWKLYGEAITQITKDDRDEDFVRYTVGFSYRENDFANSLGFDEIKPIVEFSGDETLDGQSAPQYLIPSTASRVFHNSGTARVDILHNNRWSYSLGGTYNFEKNDWTVGGGLEYRPDDNMKVQLSGALFEGDTSTHFGRWKRNDNVRLALEYSF